jgi:hypothetical protein
VTLKLLELWQPASLGSWPRDTANWNPGTFCWVAKLDFSFLFFHNFHLISDLEIQNNYSILFQISLILFFDLLNLLNHPFFDAPDPREAYRFQAPMAKSEKKIREEKREPPGHQQRGFCCTVAPGDMGLSENRVYSQL